MVNEKDSKYLLLFAKLLDIEPYSLPQDAKERLLLPILNQLQHSHRQRCQLFDNIMRTEPDEFTKLSEIPFIAVNLFKYLELRSVEKADVFKILHSSGTSGQSKSTIYLDKDTSSRQSKVLVKILQETLGKKRLPMLIIDSPKIAARESAFSARAAGIQGVAFFGRDHTYALDENMCPNWSAIDEFSEKYAQQPVLVFGFTFMVWLYFIQAIKRAKKQLSFPHGILLHSGGWKKLEAEKVNNSAFKKELQRLTKIPHVYNFYGMAEQVGSIFMECKQGHLHASIYSDILVRDPVSLSEISTGKTGLIQVISALPASYPGHSILTEDIGTVLGIDDCQCGRKGKYFEIIGRLPKTEVRGCSDTHIEIQ